MPNCFELCCQTCAVELTEALLYTANANRSLREVACFCQSIITDPVRIKILLLSIYRKKLPGVFASNGGAATDPYTSSNSGFVLNILGFAMCINDACIG